MKNLSYEEIRKSIVEALGEGVFNDTNIDSSGISTLINALAKNSHKMGYMAKMLLDESFRDTSHTMAALRAHAKCRGVEVRGMVPAVATLELKAVMPAGWEWKEVVVQRGQTFTSSNSTQDNRVFTVLRDTILHPASALTFEGTCLVYEGELNSTTTNVSTAFDHQIVTINDTGAVHETIEVEVRDSTLSEFTKLPPAFDVTTSGKPGWWSWLDFEDRRFIEIPFDSNHKEVKLTFLTTNGESGNGAKIFKINPAPTGVINGIWKATSVQCLSEPSQGGAGFQTVDELRHLVDASYKRQYRILSAKDVEDFLKEEWGDCRAIQTWGADSGGRYNGKVFICVVPKSSRVLTLGSKEAIRVKLQKMGRNGETFIFVDARSFEVNVNVVVKTSDSAVRAQVKEKIEQYWGETRSHVIFSTHAMWEAGKVKGVEAIGVSVELIAFGKAGEVIDFGIPVEVKRGGEYVDGMRVRCKGGEVTVTPKVSDFTSPRQSFYTLRQVILEDEDEV